jgi:single-strand DNA-binding protein
MSVNLAILIGHLGRDPEVTATSGGKSVCRMSLATSRRTGSGEVTEWHRVVAWDELAETCGQYLAKGRQIYVEGRLQTRTYDGKDGGKRRSTEIVAHRVVFLGRGEDRGGGQAPKSEAASEPWNPSPDDGEDGIPW